MVKKIVKKEIVKKKNEKRVEYNPKVHLKIIENLKKDGKTNVEVASFLGITEYYLYKWAKKDIKLKEILIENNHKNDGNNIKYDEKIHPLQVKYMRLMGDSVEKICEKLNIARETYYAWEKKYPEFAKAIEESKQIMLSITLEKLKDMALGRHVSEDVEERYDYVKNPDYPNKSKEPVLCIPTAKIIRKKTCMPDISALFKLLDKMDVSWKSENGIGNDSDKEKKKSEQEEKAEALVSLFSNEFKRRIALCQNEAIDIYNLWTKNIQDINIINSWYENKYSVGEKNDK